MQRRRRGGLGVYYVKTCFNYKAMFDEGPKAALPLQRMFAMVAKASEDSNCMSFWVTQRQNL